MENNCRKIKERIGLMEELNDLELMNVQGGGISFGTGLLIVAGVAFIIGVVDGIVRPLRCN